MGVRSAGEPEGAGAAAGQDRPRYLFDGSAGTPRSSPWRGPGAGLQSLRGLPFGEARLQVNRSLRTDNYAAIQVSELCLPGWAIRCPRSLFDLPLGIDD